MATTERRGAHEPDIVPPCQKDRGALRPVGAYLVGLIRDGERRSALEGGRARHVVGLPG